MKRRKGSKNISKKHYIRRSIPALIIAVLICIPFHAFLVSAQESNPAEDSFYTCYKSIEIQSGDTLWSIAEDSMTSQFDSVPECLVAIKELNQLESDEIYSGQHLIIPYEDTSRFS